MKTPQSILDLVPVNFCPAPCCRWICSCYARHPYEKRDIIFRVAVLSGSIEGATLAGYRAIKQLARESMIFSVNESDIIVRYDASVATNGKSRTGEKCTT